MNDETGYCYEFLIGPWEPQYTYIKEHFGDEAADHANYGWGICEDDNALRVATKVYGHGVLCTVVSRSNEAITHTFRPFRARPSIGGWNE